MLDMIDCYCKTSRKRASIIHMSYEYHVEETVLNICLYAPLNGQFHFYFAKVFVKETIIFC